MVIKIIDFLSSKTFLNLNYVPENEIKKVSVLRILTGLIVFFRFFEIFNSHFLIYGFSGISVIFLLTSLCILFFIIGFFTPVITILLILVIPVLDSILSTKTLGTTILINLLVVLLLTNSGRYFSVDNILFTKESFFSKLLYKIYNFIGFPDTTGIRRAYFLGFILYAISSLYALLLHIQDPYWISGVTVKSMLSNSYLCKHAFIFRDLEYLFPKVFDVISVIVTILQSVFQILMIPLIFFKAGKKYVKIWGFIFFTISLVFLSLSYLPHLELILWLVIFCPFKLENKNISILHDDKCNVASEKIQSKLIFKNDTYFIKSVYFFYLICISMFVIVNNSKYDRIAGYKESAISFKKAHIAFCKSIGIEAPQVFNNVDLSMGDNFMTIKKLKNNKWELIPFTGAKGERLNYLDLDILLFTNHNSDLLYFGNSLVYRRMLISEINNMEEFHTNGYGKEHIDFWLKYDYNRTEEVGNVKYLIEAFTSKSSKVKLFEYNSKRHNLTKTFEKIIVFNGQTY